MGWWNKLTQKLKTTKKEQSILTEKEKATARGEPFVKVVEVNIDPENPGQGYFELDWNQLFVAQLLEAGYSGKDEEEIIKLEKKNNKKIVVGYILRYHPTWKRFIDLSHKLGSPLVMRMNLNQQSSEDQWVIHKNLMKSTSPIVDCGVHYVDIMCKMTKSKPKYVNAIGSKLSDEISNNMYNYGHLQLVFEDGSIGWYEAGWGPMMSQTAFFVKDVIGPNGSVSIVEPLENTNIKSSKVDSHTKTNMLLIHNQERDDKGAFLNQDQYINTEHEPNHDQLCEIEQRYLLKVIEEDLDITQDMVDVINSMKIVLAADKSIRSGKQIKI